MDSKKQIKEAVEKALQAIMEKKRQHDMKEEEDEVLIEPFAMIDPDDEELHEFMSLADLLEQGEVEMNEEEVEELKAVADEIVPVDVNYIECDVLGESRLLLDKVNCNMKDVSLLGVTMVTPVNLIINKVSFDSEMESEKDVEMQVLLTTDEYTLMFVFSWEQLTKNGLVVVLPIETDAVELAPIEFRGMTKLVSKEELENLLTIE